MNKVYLVGNIGRIETRFSASGTAICKVSLATNERRKVGEEWQDEVTWHNLVVFGKKGDYLGKNAAKGNKLFVEGKIKNGNYTDKNGVVKYTSDVLVDNFEMMSGPRKDNAATNQANFPTFDELKNEFKSDNRATFDFGANAELNVDD